MSKHMPMVVAMAKQEAYGNSVYEKTAVGLCRVKFSQGSKLSLVRIRSKQ